MIVLLDTGVLLHLFDRSDPQHQIVRASLRALKKRGDSIVTSPQNLAEFWNACTRPIASRGGYGLSIVETAKRLRMVERLYGILAETAASFPIWKSLIVTYGVRGVKVHDARLVALLLAHGHATILTLNVNDFSRYSGINVLTPAVVCP